MSIASQLCHDLAKWLSQYLYFFSFSFLFFSDYCFFLYFLFFIFLLKGGKRELHTGTKK